MKNRIVKLQDDDFYLVQDNLKGKLIIDDYSQFRSMQELAAVLECAITEADLNNLKVGFEPNKEEHGIEINDITKTNLDEHSLVFRVIQLPVHG